MYEREYVMWVMRAWPSAAPIPFTVATPGIRIMATIESYDTAAGKRYQVRYRTPNRTQTKKRGFKTKRDAQEYAATVEVEKMTGS